LHLGLIPLNFKLLPCKRESEVGNWRAREREGMEKIEKERKVNGMAVFHPYGSIACLCN